jgi:hypothetical protein
MFKLYVGCEYFFKNRQEKKLLEINCNILKTKKPESGCRFKSLNQKLDNELNLLILVRHTSKLNHRIIVITVHSDSIYRHCHAFLITRLIMSSALHESIYWIFTSRNYKYV